MFLLFIVLVCSFFWWRKFQNTGKMETLEFSMEPLLEEEDDGDNSYVNLMKNEMKVLLCYILYYQLYNFNLF